MSNTQPSVTKSIAEFATQVEMGRSVEQLRAHALRALIDTIGVAIAARDEPTIRILSETTTDELTPGPSTVVTTGRRVKARQAALLNGAASHCLDYDDVTHTVYGHASAALVPSLLAVAEANCNPGGELLDAYVIGYQVICAIAAGMDIRGHYSKGWHSTATTGILAATAAISRLLKLDVARARIALGIAASMACGSRQNFGTMTKPLHLGLEARNAVLSAQLAVNGFTADPGQLEGPLGFFSMFDEGGNTELVGEKLNERWMLTKDGVNVKKYPCCYNTHRTADAVLAIVPKTSGSVEKIQDIRVTLEPGGADPLIRHRPVTGLEAKFSAEYVVAAALLDGEINLQSFHDSAVMRPEAQRLLRKVSMTESSTPPVGPPSWEFAYSVVEVTFSGNRVVRERIDIPKGDARLPLSDDEVERKFRDCVAHSGLGWSSDKLLYDIRGLQSGERPIRLSSMRPLG